MKYDPKKYNPRIAEFIGWKYNEEKNFWVDTNSKMIPALNFHKNYDWMMEIFIEVLKKKQTTIVFEINHKENNHLEKWYSILCKLINE